MFVNTCWNVEFNHRWLASPNQWEWRPHHNINIRKCHGQQTAAFMLDNQPKIQQTHPTHHTYFLKADLCKTTANSTTYGFVGLKTWGHLEPRQHPTHTPSRRNMHAATVSLNDSAADPGLAHAVTVLSHSQCASCCTLQHSTSASAPTGHDRLEGPDPHKKPQITHVMLCWQT
jgi:hypothetical protein